MDKNILRVATDSAPALVAGAIAGQMRDRGYSQVRAIGMAAVYQMVKAVLTAQKFLEQDGIRLAFRLEYATAKIDGKDRQAMQLYIYPANDENAGSTIEYDLDKAIDECFDHSQNPDNKVEMDFFGSK